ncbi:TerB N-terminal domain-containing protein [Acaryochloris sp. IP29b_bin.148]|uniref:tellurite resistance TerB family protein n=1 Tax=Acaryochloris sp. IP29b_bin.148 TaxID=2969218 RepID=UPI00261B6A34|nr:TerB N-terminal domain-containing protein [Acaryochloris sp. IP29b_bin.148]
MGIVHWLKRVLEPKSSKVQPSPPSDATTAIAPPTEPHQPTTEPPSVEASSAVSTPSPASPTATLPAPSSPARTTWIPADQTIHIGRYSLSGLIYVGETLAGISSHVSIEPCLIRPQLKLDEAKPDRTGQWVSQWPSYSEIPSASRAAYLEWLATGRSHPQAPIDYVYLFFYGLERRVLRDLRRSRRQILPELRTIMAEVERLQTLYGEHAAFGEEAQQFLEICRLLVPEQITALSPPWTFEPQAIPLSLAVVLGSVAAMQVPLPADWALAWAMHQSPKLRTPAIRCFPEWRYWFQREYEQAFGTGLSLEPDEDQWLPTTATYQPASVSFGGPVTLSLPDIPCLKHPESSLEQLIPLLETGTQALDGYSRWLGRNANSRGSYDALLLLPPSIMAEFADPVAKAFGDWVTTCLVVHERVVITGQDLLQRWQEAPIEKLTKAEATVLADYLARLGIGLEPDVRMGGKPPNAHSPIVLFRLFDRIPTEPSPKYIVATLLLHLSVLVAAADGEVTVAEQQRLQDYLASTPYVQESERVRLQAHLQGLLASKLSTRGLKTKLQRLSPERKQAIAPFLIHLAAVDGDINPQEISILSKLYTLLDLDPQTVFHHIHDMTLGTTPAAAPAPDELSGQSPPQPSPTTINELQLNPDLIAAKVNESATVSALLADVFIEDDAHPLPTSDVVQGIAGLDRVHSQFLQRLSQQAAWPRQDLEPIVAELGLLVDGALEIINEAAFDHCDEPLTEGEDPIDINPEVLQELLANTSFQT